MTYRPPPIGPKQLSITGPAQADMDDILDFIAHDSGVDAALGFADRLDAALFSLAHIGHAGASREWLSPGLRLITVGSFSVYFRVTETETRIVASFVARAIAIR